MTEQCPHRRYVRTPLYVCLYCGEPLPLGEPETVPVETWAESEGPPQFFPNHPASTQPGPAKTQRDEGPEGL